MDRLTELFASKPTSYTGLGLAYVGDTRGNAVVSAEQGLEVIPRQQAFGGDASRGPLSVSSGGTVKPGLVAGLMPTIGGTRLDATPAPSLGFPSSGTRYVVLEIDVDWTPVEGVYIAAPVVSAVRIALNTTAPTPANLLTSDGRFKVWLATAVDGVVTAQYLTGYVSVQVIDSGDGTARGQLYLIT